MIDRYSTKEFKKLWSDQFKFETMWKVELAALQALYHFDILPKNDKKYPNKLNLNVNRIRELELETKHETIAFISYLEEEFPEIKYIHFGLTSSDILDTTQALLLKKACELLILKLEKVLYTLKNICINHADTVLVGRSHGIHGEPTTFGYIISGHYMEFKRSYNRLLQIKNTISVGKLSGAMGNNIYYPLHVEKFALNNLGLIPESFSNQVVARDRYADMFSAFGLLACAIERIALLIRHSQRTEIGELAESFTDKQKGSSAMPHKKNPILSENLCGLSRIIRSAINPSYENISLWYERDMSHSSVERYICPDVTSTLGFMLDRLNSLLSNLSINKDRMKENLNSSYGVYASQGVLLELIKKGLKRQDAYIIVQKISFDSLNEKIDFKSKCLSNKQLNELLSQDIINECCNLDKIILNNKTHIEDILLM